MMEYDNHALVCGTTFLNDLTYISYCEAMNNGEIVSHRLIPSESDLKSARITKDVNGRFAILAMHYNTFKIYTFNDLADPACSSFTIAPLTSLGSITFFPSPCSPSNIAYSTMASNASQVPIYLENELICEFGVVNSVSSIDKNKNILIFPNPSNGIFRIIDKIISNKQVSVFNVEGVEIFRATMNGKEFGIDISGNPKGLYLLRIQNQTESIIRRLVIE